MSTPDLLVITTGGTIFQKEQDGKMSISVPPKEITEQTEVQCDISIVEIAKRTGAEMTFSTLQEILNAIEADSYDGAVLITGTDSMEEVAFALDILYSGTMPVVVCGAMKPSDILGYDGIANFNDAVKVAVSQQARGLGVLVVMNDSVHPARYVRKYDSAIVGSFRSHPGPIAEMRRGRPIFYYQTLPKNKHHVKGFDAIKADQLQIPIWTMTIGSQTLPEELLQSCDALIIAGMGTGSVSKAIISQLSPEWTEQMPIILSSRCWAGLSFDDYYYRGSLQKYEAKGFRIAEYQDLNPLQARIKLVAEISAT